MEKQYAFTGRVTNAYLKHPRYKRGRVEISHSNYPFFKKRHFLLSDSQMGIGCGFAEGDGIGVRVGEEDHPLFDNNPQISYRSNDKGIWLVLGWILHKHPAGFQ
jgi:hypothetical protein